MADWRSHASGLKQLVDMRGGFRNLMKQSPHLAPTLVVYILYAHSLSGQPFAATNTSRIMTMANTCSPSWDQLALVDSPEENIVDY